MNPQKIPNIQDLVLRVFIKSGNFPVSTRDIWLLVDAIQETPVNRVTAAVFSLVKGGLVQEAGLGYSSDPDRLTTGTSERLWKVSRGFWSNPEVIAFRETARI